MIFRVTLIDIHILFFLLKSVAIAMWNNVRNNVDPLRKQCFFFRSQLRLVAISVFSDNDNTFFFRFEDQSRNLFRSIDKHLPEHAASYTRGPKFADLMHVFLQFRIVFRDIHLLILADLFNLHANLVAYPKHRPELC